MENNTLTIRIKKEQHMNYWDVYFNMTAYWLWSMDTRDNYGQ